MKFRPPHIYLDDTWYFITAAVYQHRRLLAGDAAKALVARKIMERTAEYGIKLKAWVLLDNHYHIMIKSRLATDLPKFFRKLHTGSAYELNLLHNARGRTVWYSSWDTIIKSERGFWTRFNYIHNNPVKHGYVRHPREWPHSSYREYAAREGEAWLRATFKRNPVLHDTDEMEKKLLRI